MFERRPDIWLPAYAFGVLDRFMARLRRRKQLTHIIFLVCDHYEPRHGIKRPEQAFERVATWHKEYARLQARCREKYGTVPVHSFFFPPHHGYEHLAALSEMVFDGLGEVELHYHHDGDTEATLRSALKEVVAEFQRWGLLFESSVEPRSSFSFIHGDWALNNSRHGKLCGVNDEITILKELGCWGDLTMPSGNVCQTRKINSIYYASSSPSKPKGHDSGIDARVGLTDIPGMLMMQGPLAINWGAPDHPRVENAALTTRNWGRLDRIRKWIDCNIHVKGRPDWLFVKLHTHGAIEKDFDGLFGEKAFEMHRMLNEQFNDGQRYRLHYVTARQAYNLVKAAEHGKDGDPSQWLDYEIKQQPHSFYTINARHQLKSCTAVHLAIDNVESNEKTSLRMRVGAVQKIGGAIGSIVVDTATRQIRLCSTIGVTLAFTLEAGATISVVSGASYSGSPDADGLHRLNVTEAECVVNFISPTC
jgi:hypothetical protein